jgi:hypothetical protein
MVDRSIRVRPAQHHDLVPIAQLMQRQAMRLQSEHAVLHLIPGLEERLLQQLSQRPLVAINEHEVLRGYVLPAVWPLTEQSILHAFLTSRNGIASSLALPNPGDEDSHAVEEALLQALGAYWRSQDTYADLIRWPSHDIGYDPSSRRRAFSSIVYAHFAPLCHSNIHEQREQDGSSERLPPPTRKKWSRCFGKNWLTMKNSVSLLESAPMLSKHSAPGSLPAGQARASTTRRQSCWSLR